jgi:integrase
MSNSPGMMYLPVRSKIFFAAEDRISALAVALLDRVAILLPSIIIVVLGLGGSPVPSITVAPFKTIIPVLLCVEYILILDSDAPAVVTGIPKPSKAASTPTTANAAAKTTITTIANGFPFPLLDRKIDETTAGLESSFANLLRSINEDNAATIVKYVAAMKREVNLSDLYRRDVIAVLCKFSKYNGNNNKLFSDLAQSHILSFLDSFRKTEIQDPLHKWIGTYNLYRIHLLRFFKWLYSPDIEPDNRPKPSIMENIPQLKRKESSIYKPSDLWTPQDDLLFLKYCPSKREKCYHAISRDTSCRPHEIVKLKIKDVVFKTNGNYQYAEVLVNGKTGTRPIPLINSIPYLKDYLDHEHPHPGNPNAPLLSGVGKSLGRHLKAPRIYKIYDEYKKLVFPKLLESPEVLPEDKQRIRELLKKPWNPYIRRHSALTEKAKILREPILKSHAGWSQSSQMHLIYEHWFGNESNESLLEAYGIIDKGIQLDELRPRQCPQCNEPNKRDSRWCVKCQMVLSYDAYEETLEQQKKKESELQTIHKELDEIRELIKSKE